MVEQKHIFHTAEGMLRNHGDKATVECAYMVARSTTRRDSEAAEVWRRVMAAINTIQQQDRARVSVGMPESLGTQRKKLETDFALQLMD